MKIIKLLLLCLFVPNLLQAQSASDSLFKEDCHHKIVQWLLSQNQKSAPAKKSTVHQLIAQSTYNALVEPPTLYDSSTYFYYSDQRGATFDYYQMKYESVYYSPITGEGVYKLPLIGSDFKSTKAILCDSSMLNYSLGTPSNRTSEKVQYVNSSQIDVHDRTVKFTDTTFTQSRHTHSYDSNGLLTYIYGLDRNHLNPDWDSFGFRKMIYNTQAQVTSDTIFLLLPSGKRLYSYTNYSYDTSGNIEQMEIYADYTYTSIIPYCKYVNTYSDNKLKTIDLYMDYRFGQYNFHSVDSFDYTSGSDLFTYHKSTKLSGGSGSTIETKHLNADGLPDSIYTHTGGVAQLNAVFSYNSEGAPVSCIAYANGAILRKVFYYYGTPRSTLAVKSMPNAQANITVYPNPSTNQLNISWTDFKTGSLVNIQMISTAGQIVYSGVLNWQQTTETLSIAHLQNGIYWLSVTDNLGNALYKQAVIKQ